jgi:hypothetical protein
MTTIDSLTYLADDQLIARVLGKLAGRRVISQRPPVATQDDESAFGLSASHRVGEAHHLKRYLLFGGGTGLLPPERYEDAV